VNKFSLAKQVMRMDEQVQYMERFLKVNSFDFNSEEASGDFSYWLADMNLKLQSPPVRSQAEEEMTIQKRRESAADNADSEDGEDGSVYCSKDEEGFGSGDDDTETVVQREKTTNQIKKRWIGQSEGLKEKDVRPRANAKSKRAVWKRTPKRTDNSDDKLSDGNQRKAKKSATKQTTPTQRVHPSYRQEYMDRELNTFTKMKQRFEIDGFSASISVVNCLLAFEVQDNLDGESSGESSLSVVPTITRNSQPHGSP
jgi:hypothetical protein